MELERSAPVSIVPERFFPLRSALSKTAFAKLILERSVRLSKFELSKVEHMHFFSYYIGNYPSLKKDKIKKICKILNGVNL